MISAQKPNGECRRCGNQLNEFGLCRICDYPTMRGKYGMTPMPNNKHSRLNR